MTGADDDQQQRASPPGEDEEPEQAAVRSILRRARIPRAYDVDLLPGVQARIRQRSRGRFYGDGWSRSRASMTAYIITSILMLAILLLVYLVLMPGVRFP